MKVMAINSSARVGKESKTEIVLDHLVKGMREAGAEVDVVNLQKKKINYCIGCFTCWSKTPGQCIHKDDMSKELFPKYVESDLIVMATPLYHYTVNALLKTFIERTLPVAEPFLELRDGVTRHPRRHPQKPVVAVSVAGFPEYSVFDELSSYMNYLFKDKLVAEIYRTSSEIMSVMMKEGKVKDSLEATVQGGRELVQSMKISDETMQRINQSVSDFESMAPMANLYWQTCIDEKVTPSGVQAEGAVTPAQLDRNLCGHDATGIQQGEGGRHPGHHAVPLLRERAGGLLFQDRTRAIRCRHRKGRQPRPDDRCPLRDLDGHPDRKGGRSTDVSGTEVHG